MSGPRWGRHFHTSTADTTASTNRKPSISNAAMNRWSASSPTYPRTRSPSRAKATTVCTDGASHAHMAPTSTPAMVSPTTTRTAAVRFETYGESKTLVGATGGIGAPDSVVRPSETVECTSGAVNASSDVLIGSLCSSRKRSSAHSALRASAHRFSSRSFESNSPCLEHLAAQPSGRTWTIILRPHSEQNLGGSRPS